MKLFETKDCSEYGKDDLEILGYTNEYIKDPEIRYLLFGIEGKKIESINDIFFKDVVFNTFLFTFLVVYLNWRDTKNESNVNEEAISSNALRVFKCFENVYGKEKVDIDIALYVFTEMWCDVKKLKTRSIFTYVFSVDDAEKDISINEYRKLLESWKFGLRTAEKNSAVWKTAYDYLIKLVGPLLSNTKIAKTNENEVEITILTKPGTRFKKEKSLSSKEILIINGDSYYFLAEIRTIYKNFENQNRKKSGGLQFELVYQDFLSTRELIVTKNSNKLLWKDESLLAVIRSDIRSTNEILARRFYSVDFKYIQKLALALSDCIKIEKKRELFNIFHKKYSSIFGEENYKIRENCSKQSVKDENQKCLKGVSKLENYIVNSDNWDNYIILLLLEVGPSTLLEIIIDSSDRFAELCESISMRFDGISFDTLQNSYIEKKNSIESGIVNNKKEVNYNPDVTFSFRAIEEEIMIRTIIDAIVEYDTNEKKSTVYYVQPLNAQIKEFERYVKLEHSIEGKCVYLNDLIEKIFRFLILFYSGLLGYAKKFYSYKLNNVRVDFGECKNEFKRSVIFHQIYLKKRSAGYLVDIFIEFVTEFSKNSEMQAHLLKLIGRSYICDLQTLKELYHLNRIKKMYPEFGIPDNLTKLINETKHFTLKNQTVNHYFLKDSMVTAFELFNFLIYNKDYKSEKLIYEQISEDPVYPYVMKYQKKSETGDGFFVSNYCIKFPDEYNKETLNLLTEYDFEINELYYCIPNLLFTTQNWWVNPFLIKCKEFDELFSMSLK